MEPPPFPLAPPPTPPPPPPSSLTSVLDHLRSLLSAASTALAALPSPLLPRPATAPLTSPSPSSAAAAPPLPPPTSTVTLPLPATPPPYSDCPAVVRVTPAPIPAASSLPPFLAAECADFSSAAAVAPSALPGARILPSELCTLRQELDSWGPGPLHLPGSYTYAVARVVAALRSGVPPQWEAELQRWVLASSGRYGVVIDVAVRDHVWVLARLCLKAAAAEAGCSLERWRKRDHERSGLDPRAVRFECPRLVEGVLWLGTQLGVLYGEGNGRLFAAVVVKEAVLRMGYCLAVGVGYGAGEEGSYAGDFVEGNVFLSQVASAIAALYERFSVEKAKALQAQHPSKSQLLLEYSQALEQGHQERSNRPNYRAVLEYDGIISRRAENQESGRAKTKEELLAEERDYKRRRMSYRGKKVKRNQTEILRDIINEHMEEIKQAGGIGCLVDASEIAQNMLKSNSHEGIYQGSYDPASTSSYYNQASGSWLPSHENSPHADSLGRLSSKSREKRDLFKNSRYESHGNRYQNISEHENKRSVASESELDQSYPHRYESKRHQRNSNDDRNYSYNHKKDVSDYYFESSNSTARSAQSQRSSVTEHDYMLGRCSDRSGVSQKRHRSVSVTQHHFSDRYDPESMYSDGDPPTNMHYDVTE